MAGQVEASLKTEERDGTTVLIVSGRLDAQAAGHLWHNATRTAHRAKVVRLDLTSLKYCDMSGAALLVAIEATHPNPADPIGASPRIVDLLKRARIAATAPPSEGEALERLRVSMAAYLAWVEANREGYLSLVRGAASDATLREVYDGARFALTDRIFASVDSEEIPDTPVVRLVVKGWASYAEELVLSWVAEPGEVTREQLVDLLSGSLVALVLAAA